MSRPTDLVQGTLDLLVLKILALQPMHGWAIGERMAQMSKDTLQVSPGSLYPALHKLEQAGWIEAEWSVNEAKRRVKFIPSLRKAASGFGRRPPIGSAYQARSRQSYSRTSGVEK